MIILNKALLTELVNIAWQASDKVLAIYQQPIEFSTKDDGSPLTEADMASHLLIADKLSALFPDTIIISEEGSNLDQLIWDNPKQFWLIDPLDGTKEFINRNGEFTINIALIEHGQPVLGIVCAPALNVLYAGMREEGAFKVDKLGNEIPIVVMDDAPDGFHIVGSRSHGDVIALQNFLGSKKVASFIATGSSLKFCRVAEGAAHLYPRLGRTMEWDTAAGHAVLLAAGGSVECLDGQPLRYGKTGFENPHFVAKSNG